MDNYLIRYKKVSNVRYWINRIFFQCLSLLPIGFVVGCSTSGTQTVSKVEKVIRVDTMVRYFKDFDEYLLKGINEISEEKLAFPYVAAFYFNNKLTKFIAYKDKITFIERRLVSSNFGLKSVVIHKSRPEIEEIIYRNDTVYTFQFYAPEHIYFLVGLIIDSKGKTKRITYDSFDLTYDRFQGLTDPFNLVGSLHNVLEIEETTFEFGNDEVTKKTIKRTKGSNFLAPKEESKKIYLNGGSFFWWTYFGG